jgi:hypothetical protein
VPKQEYLRPHDVPVLLQLSIGHVETFRQLAAAVGLSLGESHAAVKRLELARLVLFQERSLNRAAALEFPDLGGTLRVPADSRASHPRNPHGILRAPPCPRHLSA